MMKNLLGMDYFLTILWICSITSVGSAKVSFFGDSHVAMPLQEAKLSTYLRLRFRTRQDNGILFLAAGRTDYCLLSIDDGRIKLNLKINEHFTEVWSPLKVNDRQWHDIAFQRYDTNVTIQIDEPIIRKVLPPQTGELNIHFGVFFGGLGDFSESYLNAVDNFRGCMSDVFYNNINVLKRAKERTSHVTSVHVLWTCSAEFDADQRQGISFVRDDSFVMFNKPAVETGESWNLELKTIETVGMVLYNSAADFIALEIVNSRLRFLVGKGSNAVELVSDRNVTDGKWHNVSIAYSPFLVELVVDETVHSATFASKSSNILEIGEEYFIGGLSTFRQRKATQRGLKAQSFNGCIQNLMVDKHNVGFPHMKVTHAVEVDCVWKYPCLEKDPCISSGTCHQYEHEDFICYCEQAYCIKADYDEHYKIFTRSDLPREIELLSINPLQLLEGDSVFLSTSYIDVLIDYARFGIMEAGIIFNIVSPPKHGRVIITSEGTVANSTVSSKVFSLIELGTDKVKYIHNGAEQPNDHMTIDLQLITANRDSLPDILHGKHRFVLHANITPVNDAPVLRMNPNKVLRLTQGIPKVITADLLTADDPDSPPNALHYSIVPPSEPDSPANNGVIEVSTKRTNTFTQEDINLGIVTYLVDSQTVDDKSFDLVVQVSDGMETSEKAYLPVSVLPLQLRMINNTGLVLIHKSIALITPCNLSFVSNSEDDNIDVKYTIVKQPQFGNIQRLRAVDSSWINVDSFTSNQIHLGQVRYIHNTDSPVHDDFKFTVSFGPIKSNKYDFRLTFTKLKIGIQIQNSVQINGTKEKIITNINLFHQTTPLQTFPRNIIYTVITPPKYGLIYVNGYPEYAKEMDSFTQQDIDKNLIRYRTYQTCYSSFIDLFEFVISVPECEDVFGSIKIIYNPPEELSHMLSYQTRELIHVKEGDRAQLNRKQFEVLFNKFNFLMLKLAIPPRNGVLCNVNSETMKISQIDSFSLEKLYLGDIYYAHDDSETTTDSMYFLVMSDINKDFQYVCEVLVDISLINDNAPYRLDEKIFHVVRNRSKIVSPVDLRFIDPDINTNATEIKYTKINSTSIEFCNAGSGRTLNEFSQDDIDQGRILLKHTNDTEMNEVSFVVTDGLFQVPSKFEVIASEPFINITEKNATVVQESKYILIKMSDLAMETNLNIMPDEVEYTVLEGPNYGVLKILRRKFNGTILARANNNTISVKNFTQTDVLRERLIYWNSEVASMDKIRYRVTAKGISAEGEITYRLYPAAYWDLLQIRRNKTLYVEESTSVMISRDILEIVHPNISPGDITYLVTQSPQQGYLEIQSITSDDEYNCKVFDQSTINSEKMFYIQAGVNQSVDHFMFDVTNGITWLRGLMLKIVIIPENLYMQTRNVSVEEGKALKLEPMDMVPFSDYYRGKILEYRILQQPAFGDIKSETSKVNRFTHKQLESGTIYYVHDGSENATDVLKIVAAARNKESVPFDFYITIIQVNDEKPQVVTNTGLQMWVGGRSPIKNTDLMAQDYDTTSDQIRFMLLNVVGGIVVHQDDVFSTPLTNFTQHEINENQIYFQHTSNKLHGQIDFYVTDGDHTSPDQTLFITTNPVNLEQIHNEILHVFPLTRKQIMPDQLKFKCSDEFRDVIYEITINPQFGRIVYEHQENNSSHEVTEFTQHDVNEGRIVYEHTHATVELKSNDSFYFDVRSKLANSLIDQVFNIEISVSSGGLVRFLPVNRLNLDEGEKAPIKLDLSKVLEYLATRAGIQSPELYIDIFQPTHGIIAPKDGTHNLTRATLDDFTSERVYYLHDHSDSVEDKIRLSVYLQQGNIFLCNLTIPVIVNPINDHEFYLVTQSPQMTIIEGENRTITNKELLTEDADTVADELIYDIISAPTIGILMKISDEGIAQDIMTYGNRFSQLDINENRIIYVHNQLPTPTTFYFKVSDGKFAPVYEIFNLKVIPVTVGPGNDRDMVYMQQGANSTFIRETHFAVDTNADRHRLVYNVTDAPKYGVLLCENRQTSRFTYAQLVNKKIIYFQTDMSKSSDNFKVSIYVPDTTQGLLENVDVKIIVEPLIKLNGISIASEDRIKLTTSFMDENPYQLKLNRYNPKIVITRKPEHGKIKKIIRNTGDLEHSNDKDIASFTYKELKSGVIYFIARKLPDDVVSVNDYFEYALFVKTYQPGQAFVSIEIHKLRSHLIETAVDKNDNVNIAYEASFPVNYLFIVATLAAMFVLVMVLIIFLRCHSNAKANKNDLDKDYPPPLPRPPDFMTINNNRMYSPSDGEDSVTTSLPILSSIPHCKVIPINNVEDSESDEMIDLNNVSAPQQLHRLPCYSPYGDEPDEPDEQDEWSSSCDVANEVNYSSILQPTLQRQQHSNPLLRRNQYWV